jgi:hypothetical protein
MSFQSYSNIDKAILNEIHETKSGFKYSIFQDERFRVEMRYIGKEKSNSNKQGWERSNISYFKALLETYPEMFSKRNISKLNRNKSPIIDHKMIEFNPSWENFKGQKLIHHHIGGDGEAVAVPAEIHKGQGGIHVYEKLAGINEKCVLFSNQCDEVVDSYGKTALELHIMLENKKANLTHNNDGSNLKFSESNTITLSDLNSQIAKLSDKIHDFSFKIDNSSHNLKGQVQYLSDLTQGSQSGENALNLIIQSEKALDNITSTLSLFIKLCDEYLEDLRK